MAQRAASSVTMAFEQIGQRIAIADIRPLKRVCDAVRKTRKYEQIAASIREIGVIEPPIVARARGEAGKYLLLDGQEHRMILKAIERGASEARIAKALNVDVANIRRKRRLLEGICAEVAEILKDKHMAIHAFAELRRMLPIRQIEAAELMVAMNKYTISYAKSLLAATPQSQLVEPTQPKRVKGLTGEQIALIERESLNLEREFRLAERSYGTDHLDLVLINGYLGNLLGNAQVVRFLSQHHREILTEFQKLTEMEAAAA
jgi:hypothetical protein